MNQAIASNQLAYSVSAFILASNLLTSHLYQFAKNDSWVSVLMGFVASLLIIGIYTALSKRYPGKGLFDINNAVFGKALGKVISFFYVFYFLSLAFFNTRDLGDFIKGSVLQQTPLMIIMISFIIVCAWAVRKGPVSITRYGFLATFITIAATVTYSLFLLDKIELRHLMPAFTLPVKNYLIGTHIVTMLPFGEMLVFLMFIPHMYRPQDFGRVLTKGLIISAAMLLVVVFRDTVVLGKFISIFTMPSYYAARYVDIGDILTRVEIIYAIILISLLFFKVSIVYYAGVSGISKLVGFENYRPLINIIGVLICIYAMACFSSMAEHVKWGLTVAATYSTLFILLLPLLTLLVSLIRESAAPKGSLTKS